MDRLTQTEQRLTDARTELAAADSMRRALTRTERDFPELSSSPTPGAGPLRTKGRCGT
ncbi:hypothetical protein NKH18_23935 [Streptomyces sp. M10(2022)]